MKKTVLAILFFLTQSIVCAQNLVPNPSFEEYSQCPQNMNQIDLAVSWYHEAINHSEGDFFNMCDPTLGGVWHFYQTQNPHTGNGMAGFAIYSSPSANYEYREYDKVKLLHSLSPNTNYCISYYVSLVGYSTYAIDGLCACISTDSLLCQDPNIMLLPCTNYVCNTSGNIIKDTLNWVKVTMSYIAHGGEQFLTLGNFKTTPQTNSEETDYHPYGHQTYYFIDDVAVYECDAPVYPANVPDQSPCKGETVTLGSQTRSQYQYEWKDAAGNVIGDQGSITIVADTSTYYVLKQKDFKFDETTDTCFITVDPFCLHIPNVITPSGDGSNDFFVIQGGSELSVSLQLFNRWGKIVYQSNHYLNNWPAKDIADGVYFYVVKATSATGESKEYQGSVSVIK
jgi:gliding motility-associated-like protein